MTSDDTSPQPVLIFVPILSGSGCGADIVGGATPQRHGLIAIGDLNLIGDGTCHVTRTTPVREPAPTWLLAAGLVALAVRRRRNRSTA